MLARYTDAEAGVPPPATIPGGDPSRLLLPPKSWNDAFRELERCLKRMRSQGHQQAVRYDDRGKRRSMPLATAFWHVRQWWLDCRVKTESVTRTVTLKGGRKAVVPHQVRKRVVYVRHPDARESKAMAGAKWLAGEYRWDKINLRQIREACGEVFAKEG